ncbi:MAG: hypothetical protein CM15mP65_15600 [Crocinitomicaceae bacterium]|nr:MAG: hypothetical protein CM15mP65_15600 [Crocinitomicaceae bacterium]
MAYGEDSWLGNHGGNDMIWNPSAAVQLGFGGFGSGTILEQESILFIFLETVKMKLMESIEVMFKNIFI